MKLHGILTLIAIALIMTSYMIAALIGHGPLVIAIASGGMMSSLSAIILMVSGYFVVKKD